MASATLKLNGQAYACFVAVDPDYPRANLKLSLSLCRQVGQSVNGCQQGVNEATVVGSVTPGRIFPVVAGATYTPEVAAKAKA